jgi:hypothetical protein
VWQRNEALAALILAALILAVPLWLVAMPAMPDYPAHLATFWLIGGGVSPFYHVAWSFVPNLASEILVPALARFFGLAAATSLFLSLAVGMWVLGGGLVQRALYGRIGIAPLLGAFFAYNANFLWGFFNYDFAAGLALVLFAAWIATEGKGEALRLTGFAAGATFLYFCHIFAVAVLLVMIAGYEAGSGSHMRRWGRSIARVSLIFLPAALAFLFLRPKGDAGRVIFNLADTARDRFESLIGTGFDQPLYLLPLLLLGLWLLALLSGRARVHRAMIPVLAMLLPGALFAPESAMGGWGVHLRLPALFCVVLFAATDFTIGRRLAAAAAIALLAMIGANAAALTRTWHATDRQFRELRAALDHLPRGQRLMSVMDNPGGTASDQPYWHLAELAIMDRGDMTPLMFATQGQHVVALAPAFRHWAATTAEQGSPPNVTELAGLASGEVKADPAATKIFPYLIHFPCHYDEALVIRSGASPSAAPALLKLRHQGSFFSLYDIDPKACRR